jgi:hypothetical protein
MVDSATQYEGADSGADIESNNLQNDIQPR